MWWLKEVINTSPMMDNNNNNNNNNNNVMSIYRKIRSRTDHSGDVKVHDIALHEFKLINSNGQKTILSDLPFKSLSDYAGKALAVSTGNSGGSCCHMYITICLRIYIFLLCH